MKEVLNEQQKARAFDAFWVAYGTGTDEEKATAEATFEGIPLTGYLAGALVEAALGVRAGEARSAAEFLNDWFHEWAGRLQAQHDADLARRPPADCGPAVPFK